MKAPEIASTGAGATGSEASACADPNNCPSNPAGVGSVRRSLGSSLPSGFRIRQPAIPASGCASSTAAMLPTVSGRTRQSGFRNRTSSPRAWRNARLLAAAKPRLPPVRNTRRRESKRASASTASILPSCESLSATNTSMRDDEASADCTHSTSKGPLSWLTMMTDVEDTHHTIKRLAPRRPDVIEGCY